MPSIKVTYFDGPGRAELTRLVLTAGGVAFEDERLDGAAFGAMKPTLPLGQLPVVTVDGTTYAQSMAMARYAGRVAGMYPTEPLDALKVDTVVETLVELVNGMVDIVWHTKEEEAKAEKTKKFVEETIPSRFGMIEKQIAGKFLLGDNMSLADVQLFDVSVNGLATFKEFSVSAYPKVAAIVEAVQTNENVAAYLAKHKK